MSAGDYLLYKEALSASGYTIVKTEELAQLRATIAAMQTEHIEAQRTILECANRLYQSRSKSTHDVCIAWLDKYKKQIESEKK